MTSFRVNINNMGNVVDEKIRVMRSDVNAGVQAKGLDKLIDPIRRELVGAQGNLLQERRNLLKKKVEEDRTMYEQELNKKGLAMYYFF